MPHVEVDHTWECEEVVHDDDEFSGNNNVDESKSLMIKFYMHPDSSYRKEWRYANSEGYNKLLYKIDKAVDVTQNNSVEIDVDMLSTAPMPAALRISEKVLICLKPAACENNLKVLASDIISKSRQIISSSATAKPNNKCSFLMIVIHVRYNVFIYLDEKDMKLLEQHKRVLPPDYSTLLKPLPILKSDANNPFELCEERCAICWEGYLEGSRMIRLQCLHELQYIGGSDSDIIRLPCTHEFHANCIATWSKTTNSCPLCRFEISCASLIAILAHFDFPALY